MAKATDFSTKKNYAGGMIIDGIAASEAIDSSGEVFSVEGADITSLKDGTATLNWEHRGDDSPDHTASDHVGIITFAKKVFSAADCDNDRELMYWDDVKLPFIYIKARLYDGAGHRAAQDLAAQIRDHHLNGEPVLVRFSIEGQTITQEGPLLKETICKRVAATIKPCNRSCHSGVLEDPNSPFADQVKAEEDALKSIKKNEREFEHPLYSRLSVAVTRRNPWVREHDRCETLQKALEAGSGDAAPSTLTQGAALARSWKNKAMAAFRDWDGDGDLRDVLKSKLPEASEEFVNHFADLVDEFKLGKIKKAEKKPAKPPKQPTSPLPETPPAPAPAAPTDWSDAQFDSKRGVLHSNGRKFRVSIPTDGAYRQALTDPHVREIHGRAMHNWSIVHKLLSKGRVLPGVLAAAAINAGFSSNTAVPLQELAFGHFKDLGNQGHDVLSGPLTADQEQTLRAKFKSRVLPVWMRDWYQKHPEGIVSKDGTVRIVGLQDDKIDAANFYHRIHPILHELLDRHGADGQAVARSLIGFKHEYDLWKSRARAAAAKDGRPLTREDRLAHDGPVVEQLAVKTLRYAVAMLGAGNMIVPDTHFIRHFFGLPIKHPDNDFIKSVLLDPRNAHILDQIDQYHTRHHPAAQAVRDWYFDGKDNPMVTFPAFWLHWLSIAAHDKLRQVPGAGLAHHGNTAHDPFFNAVAEAMRENGVPGHEKMVIKGEGPHSLPLPFRCALACEKLRREHGEGAAQIAFWAHMAPLLHDVEAEHLVAKFENLRDTLLAKAEKLNEPAALPFNGRMVQPGAAEGLGSNVAGEQFMVVHRDHDHVYVLPRGKTGPGDLRRWPVEREGTHYRVLTNPTLESEPQAPEHHISGDALPGVIWGMRGKDMPVGLDSIYTLYAVHPKDDGTPTRVISGRFLVHGGQIHVLEDHFGALHAILSGDGAITPEMKERLETLHHSQFYDLVSDGQVQRGERPDLVPVEDLGEPHSPEEEEEPQAPARPQPVWEYHRQGLKTPQVIESKDGAMRMNGQPLSHEEILAVLDNVRKGVATLTYRKVE